jgi:hypothetical protein
VYFIFYIIRRAASHGSEDTNLHFIKVKPTDYNVEKVAATMYITYVLGKRDIFWVRTYFCPCDKVCKNPDILHF